MKELRTLTPFGLELVTSLGITRISSQVCNKGRRIYHSIDTLNTPNEDRLKEHHEKSLSDFLRLAVDKDLSKPIN